MHGADEVRHRCRKKGIVLPVWLQGVRVVRNVQSQRQGCRVQVFISSIGFTVAFQAVDDRVTRPEPLKRTLIDGLPDVLETLFKNTSPAKSEAI